MFQLFQHTFLRAVSWPTDYISLVVLSLQVVECGNWLAGFCDFVFDWRGYVARCVRFVEKLVVNTKSVGWLILISSREVQPVSYLANSPPNY